MGSKSSLRSGSPIIKVRGLWSGAVVPLARTCWQAKGLTPARMETAMGTWIWKALLDPTAESIL